MRTATVAVGYTRIEWGLRGHEMDTPRIFQRIYVDPTGPSPVVIAPVVQAGAYWRVIAPVFDADVYTARQVDEESRKRKVDIELSPEDDVSGSYNLCEYRRVPVYDQFGERKGWRLVRKIDHGQASIGMLGSGNSKGDGPPFNGTCHKCHASGHKARDCKSASGLAYQAKQEKGSKYKVKAVSSAVQDTHEAMEVWNDQVLAAKGVAEDFAAMEAEREEALAEVNQKKEERLRRDAEQKRKEAEDAALREKKKAEAEAKALADATKSANIARWKQRFTGSASGLVFQNRNKNVWKYGVVTNEVRGSPDQIMLTYAVTFLLNFLLTIDAWRVVMAATHLVGGQVTEVMPGLLTMLDAQSLLVPQFVLFFFRFLSIFGAFGYTMFIIFFPAFLTGCVLGLRYTQLHEMQVGDVVVLCDKDGKPVPTSELFDCRNDMNGLSDLKHHDPYMAVVTSDFMVPWFHLWFMPFYYHRRESLFVSLELMVQLLHGGTDSPNIDMATVSLRLNSAVRNYHNVNIDKYDWFHVTRVRDSKFTFSQQGSSAYYQTQSQQLELGNSLEPMPEMYTTNVPSGVELPRMTSIRIPGLAAVFHYVSLNYIVPVLKTVYQEPISMYKNPRSDTIRFCEHIANNWRQNRMLSSASY